MTDGVTLINYAVVVAVALVSSTAFWAFLQFVVNRRGTKAIAAKQEAEAESTREQAAKVRDERIALAQEAAHKAYQDAEASYARRYRNLEQDYDTCRSGLTEIREAVRPLLVAIEKILYRVLHDEGDVVNVSVTREEINAVSQAVSDARHHLA